MNNRKIIGIVAGMAATLGASGVVHAQTTLEQVENSIASQATAIQDSYVMTGNAGYGSLSAAAVTPCFVGCVGAVPGYSIQVLGGPTASASIVNVNVGGTGNGQSQGSLPIGTHAGNNVLSNLSASASEDGVTGSEAASGTMVWDTLSFHNYAPGAMATVDWTLTLAPTAHSYIQEGFGGGCIAVNSICNPFGLTPGLLTSSGQTVTLQQTFALAPSVLMFEALYTATGQSFNLASATIDPSLTISLPAGVTFTSAGGVVGGTPAPVPLPGTLGLFGLGAAALTAMSRTRRSGAKRS